MLEKGLWFQAPDGVLDSSFGSDSVKEMMTLASDGTSISSYCFKPTNISVPGADFCFHDPILGDRCTSVENDLYSYPFCHISQRDSDLSFFDNDRVEKQSSNDPLYCEWPNIENFEDVDRMFRSCDSTFGTESVINRDGFCWFSPSHSTEESEGTLKSDLKFSSSESGPIGEKMDIHEVSQPYNLSCLVNSSNKSSLSSNSKKSCHTYDSEGCSLFQHTSLIDGLGTASTGQEGGEPRKQVCQSHEPFSDKEKQPIPKHKKLCEGKRKDHYMENVSLHHFDRLNESTKTKFPYEDSSYQEFSSSLQQKKKNVGPASFYLQSGSPCTYWDYCYPADQISPTLSPKGSSHTPNHVQFLESSLGPSYEEPAVRKGYIAEMLYDQQDLSVSFGNLGRDDHLASQAAFSDKASGRKKVYYCDNEVEGHSEVEGVSMEILGDVDNFNIQESCCMTSLLDDTSQEATSFRQLQHVMEQMDISTKLCIRDSLYRLATSAEQRRNCTYANGGCKEGNRSTEELIQEKDECTGFADVETDTNPIDRYMAHLLFHRPSDLSARAANDVIHQQS